MHIYQDFLSTSSFLAAGSPQAMLAHMLRFEAALAQSQAELGLIPQAAATVINNINIAQLDCAAILAQSREAGSLAIPFVKHLTAAVAKEDAAAAKFVHWGATSQDVIDTAQSLFAQTILRTIVSDARESVHALAQIGASHKATPVLARTLMQPALVTSFGLKAARWALGLQSALQSLEQSAAKAIQLQFGGATGTLASLAPHGEVIKTTMAKRLGLSKPVYCWHTERSNWVSFAAQLAVLAGAAGKLAKDVSLMMQYEVGELAEPSAAGRGGSSAMPHKRNPVFCLQALAGAQTAAQAAGTMLQSLPQEHERSLSNWQSELFAFHTLLGAASSAIDAVKQISQSLEIFPEKMQRNIDALLGLPNAEQATLALAGDLGKQAAHVLVEAACKRAIAAQKSLLSVLQETAEVKTLDNATQAKLAAAFDAQVQLQPVISLTENELNLLETK